jgi:hypothetical protein
VLLAAGLAAGHDPRLVYLAQARGLNHRACVEPNAATGHDPRLVCVAQARRLKSQHPTNALLQSNHRACAPTTRRGSCPVKSLDHRKTPFTAPALAQHKQGEGRAPLKNPVSRIDSPTAPNTPPNCYIYARKSTRRARRSGPATRRRPPPRKYNPRCRREHRSTPRRPSCPEVTGHSGSAPPVSEAPGLMLSASFPCFF